MRRQWRPAPEDADRGSEAIEAAIGVPAFLLFVALVIAAGRLAIAQQAVEAAADDAARSASISRNQGQAQVAGQSAATSGLTNQGLRCLNQRVVIDTSEFSAPVGTAAQAGATVTCVVNLSDVTLPGLPGTKTITVTRSSPIDTYRERD